MTNKELAQKFTDELKELLKKYNAVIYVDSYEHIHAVIEKRVSNRIFEIDIDFSSRIIDENLEIYEINQNK